jgi:hypothetical protein
MCLQGVEVDDLRRSWKPDLASSFDCAYPIRIFPRARSIILRTNTGAVHDALPPPTSLWPGRALGAADGLRHKCLKNLQIPFWKQFEVNQSAVAETWLRSSSSNNLLSEYGINARPALI